MDVKIRAPSSSTCGLGKVLKELETHLLLAERVGLIHLSVSDSPLAACEAVGKMLRSLIRSLQSRKEGRDT
jgi:hypothetical protein